MSTFQSGQGGKFFFSNDDDRPSVASYIAKPKFHVGDKVYLRNSNGSREGPCQIASLPSTGKYTLSHENGQPVKNGEEIETDCVEAA